MDKAIIRNIVVCYQNKNLLQTFLQALFYSLKLQEIVSGGDTF